MPTYCATITRVIRLEERATVTVDADSAEAARAMLEELEEDPDGFETIRETIENWDMSDVTLAPSDPKEGE